MRRCSPPLYAAFALLVVLSPLAAQPSASTERSFGESIEVRVVNVDVVVTDRDGQPVQGLAREDFRVLEDARPQEITNFYRVEGPRIQAGEAKEWETISADSSFRRRVLLLLDNNFITTPERDRAVAALEGYLDQKFDGSYEWSVVSVGDETRVLEPFTSDKLRVRAALDRVRQQPTFGTRYRLDRFFLNDPVRVRRAQRSAAAGQAGLTSEGSGEMQRSLRFESTVSIATTLHAFERTATAMLQAFRASANLPGNKVLVWITGGVPMLPEYNFQGGGNAPRGGLDEKDTDLRQYQTELRKLVDSIAYEANSAQFKVYPVKANGLVPQAVPNDAGFRSSGATFSETAMSSSVEVDDDDSAQLSLALGTGGLYLTSNRTLESFEAVDRDTTSYYSLGYRPTRAEDGKFHQVKVEVVGKPGLVVRARSGYVDLSPEQKLEMVLATPLPFPREKGSLPVAVVVERRGRGEIVAIAKLPSARLTFLEQDGFYVGRVKIYLTIHDAAGNLVDLVSQEQDVRFPAAQKNDALAGEFRYGLKFKLKEKGDYVLSVTVRDEATEEIGTAFSNVEI